MNRSGYHNAYYLAHKEKFYKQAKQWQKENPIFRRAIILLSNYKRNDKNAGIGEGDLTPKWIMENIFTKPCAHCGKTGWDVIGCNRIDNSKPHTMDNVEPCCKECNDMLSANDKKKKVYQYTLDGELVKIWSSAREAKIDGFNRVNIINCCKGGYFYKGKWCNVAQHKGYRWSFEPL